MLSVKVLIPFFDYNFFILSSYILRLLEVVKTQAMGVAQLDFV